MGIHWERTGVGSVQRGPRARLHLHARNILHERHVRWPSPWGQSLHPESGRRRRGDRGAGLALPTRPPRIVGLRSASRSHSDGPGRRRTSGPGHYTNHQAGIRVRVRPGDGRAGLALRGTSCPPIADTRRADITDPAVSDEAPGLRPARCHDRRSDRFHARAARRGPRDRRALHAWSALHAAFDHRGRAERQPRDDPATWFAGRRQRTRRVVRSRDEHSVRALHHHAIRRGPRRG